MDFFSTATRAWFNDTFAEPTRVQRLGWPHLSRGENALLVAPTGSGKTLAAFLWAVDRLGQLDLEAPPGVRVLYVSPLKALVYDIERNLRAPLVGIRRSAEKLGQTVRALGVDVRTGDTPAGERRRQLRRPGEILVTTPESLFLLLGSQAAETLRSVHTVIVDEIHAFAPSKRGVHLTLSLERLAELCSADPQRIGLSATVRPAEEAARFLGGDRPVAMVDAGEPAHVALEVVVPVADMENPTPEQAPACESKPADLYAAHPSPHKVPDRESFGLWPRIYPRLLELIQGHRSTIVFVNSRGLCERLAQRLNELALGQGAAEDEPLVLAHHGSISHRRRSEIEEALKAGRLKGIVATSSLELGIDMGSVDLVVLVESPGSVTRGLQRVGRAGHGVGELSRGIVFPKFRGDLLECAVVATEMRTGVLEPIRVPRNALDVLAQQVVALCCTRPRTVDEILRLVHRAYPYRDLSRDALTSLLDMLSGRYPSDELADLRPRLSWDRSRDLLTARRGARTLTLLNAGTIPDRGLYGVFLGEGGPRVGELDEEMVHESRKGDTFLLGATTWRVTDITRDRVLVTPAPGEPGRMPFWRGDGPGRPVELGRAIGAFLRRLTEITAEEAEAWLERQTPLDEYAIRNLLAYVDEQRSHTGTLPTDRALTVERFRDELGDWRICILTPFGSRLHAPWAMALEQRLSCRAGFQVQSMYTDDGIVLRFADAEELPPLEDLLPQPEEVEDLIVEQVGHSALFASTFRENAARALLLPRRRPHRRTALWQQRLRARDLLAVARRYPSFPILLETYRQCLQDVFDVPSLVELLAAVQRRELRVDEIETSSASPFARSLVFAYVANYLYEQDAPLAERKAQALTLDRGLLRELLGQAELRELIDPLVLDQLEEELQGLSENRRARDPDELHDLMRRVGDLTVEELKARSASDPSPWLATLEEQRRAVLIKVAGEERWVATEDVSRYRDALGAVPPPGLPDALLTAAAAPLEELVRRYARAHGPFLSRHVAHRLGLLTAQVEPVLVDLESQQRILRGEIRPGGTEPEWCDPEVLRRLKRRTLAKLRHDVAPVESAALARFLPSWHGVEQGGRRPARLEEVLAQLEGLVLPWSTLSQVLLPARVDGFRPEMLDTAAASGQIVWVGSAPLGPRDGRLSLFHRERAALLLPQPPPYEPPSRLHAALLEHLGARGASFTVELQRLEGAGSAVELEAALWDLVWAGQITNDTLLPLRTLGARRRRTGRSWERYAGRGARRPAAPGLAGGRWSLVTQLLQPELSATERAFAAATMLLERYGVVSREAVLAEEIAGGFAALYPVLKEMEETGRVRRGYFVEGLGGSQFALPGAVERLRAERREQPDGPGSVLVLAAVDPANPYGSLLPWPERGRAEGPRPRRVPGAWVILRRGQPLMFLEASGRALVTFGALQDEEEPGMAVQALRRLPRRMHKRSLRLERIDGLPARESPHAPLFLSCGFTADYRGLRASE